MQNRRIVVTGMGMLTALGLNVESTWKGICEGKSGARIIDSFDVSNFACKFSASVQGFNPEDFDISSKDVKKMDLFIQYGIAAIKEAFEDSKLDLASVDLERVGIALGSGIGGLATIEKTYVNYIENGPRKISPFFIPSTIINMAPGYASIRYGFKGPNLSVVSACTTGAHNIGEAAYIISRGDADVMFAGGCEMATCPLGLGGFAACRALSLRNDDPALASRPWDRDRDGFLLGDGAGVLVLESYDHAVARGAKIYAELVGYGLSADAYHMTSPPPNGEGARRAMQNALKSANLESHQVDYINAHATSTPSGDDTEAQAIETLFGEHAFKVAVSSTKSMTGHLLGAAGGIEAIFSILAIRDQIAPPTINLDNPSENCRLNFVPHKARPMKIDIALSNSFGFGGTNGSLIFKKMD